MGSSNTSRGLSHGTDHLASFVHQGRPISPCSTSSPPQLNSTRPKKSSDPYTGQGCHLVEVAI